MTISLLLSPSLSAPTERFCMTSPQQGQTYAQRWDPYAHRARPVPRDEAKIEENRRNNAAARASMSLWHNVVVLQTHDYQRIIDFGSHFRHITPATLSAWRFGR